MVKKTYKVEGMACEHCKARVESVLRAIDGVVGAVADVGAKNVVVEYDAAKVSPADLKEAVEDAGYGMEL
ncbi:MAG: heavy-metal-associated domain-containing protein [Bacteroidales bacterium]|nr:heavy-metal-associated domain-containing protein [Bacteroidales bacterium]